MDIGRKLWSFAMVPIGLFLPAPSLFRIPAIAGLSVASLAALGALVVTSAGAPPGRASLRVAIGAPWRCSDRRNWMDPQYFNISLAYSDKQEFMKKIGLGNRLKEDVMSSPDSEKTGYTQWMMRR